MFKLFPTIITVALLSELTRAHEIRNKINNNVDETNSTMQIPTITATTDTPAPTAASLSAYCDGNPSTLWDVTPYSAPSTITSQQPSSDMITCERGLACRRNACVPLMQHVGDPCGPVVGETPDTTRDPICNPVNMTCVLKKSLRRGGLAMNIKGALRHENDDSTVTSSFASTTTTGTLVPPTSAPAAVTLLRQGVCHPLVGIGKTCGGHSDLAPVCLDGLQCLTKYNNDEEGSRDGFSEGQCVLVVGRGQFCGVLGNSTIETLCQPGLECVPLSSGLQIGQRDSDPAPGSQSSILDSLSVCE